MNSSNKETKALKTIGEASDIIGLEPYVLRFWESKFSKLRPKKRHNRRYYTVRDIAVIKMIQNLLHVRKMSIEDAKTLLMSIKTQEIVEFQTEMFDENNSVSSKKFNEIIDIILSKAKIIKNKIDENA